MAEDILNRFIDVNPQYGVFSNDILVVGDSAINSSIENILGTIKGERVFNPEFGSKVGNLLFDPINENTAERIFLELTNAIELWEPRIRVDMEESYVIPLEDENMYQVLIIWRLLDSDSRGEFETTIR